MKTPPTHIIYDLDGLLLDTEIFYTIAGQQTVAPFGKTYGWELKSKLLGRPALESAKTLVEYLSLPLTPQEYLERREPILRALFPTAQALAGAREITRYFKQKSIPQAIATSSNSAMFALKTQNHQDWLNDFNVIVKGDDARIKRGKPAPDIFLLAAQEMGAEPSQCLVFEDAPAGIQAAKAAGMRVIAIPDANMDLNLYKEADQILRAFTHFKPEDWNL